MGRSDSEGLEEWNTIGVSDAPVCIMRNSAGPPRYVLHFATLSEANPMSKQELEIKAGCCLTINVDPYSHVLVHYCLAYGNKQQLFRDSQWSCSYHYR